jgi:hypothetical protein
MTASGFAGRAMTSLRTALVCVRINPLASVGDIGLKAVMSDILSLVQSA